jgi:hypothetical protein
VRVSWSCCLGVRHAWPKRLAHGVWTAVSLFACVDTSLIMQQRLLNGT